MADINDIKKNDIKSDDVNNVPKTDSVRDLSKDQNPFKHQTKNQPKGQVDDENLVLDTAGGEMPDAERPKSTENTGITFSKNVDKQKMGQKDQSSLKEKKAV